MCKSVALISAILLIVSVASAQSAQAAKAGLLSAVEVKKVLPSDFFSPAKWRRCRHAIPRESDSRIKNCF